MEDCIFCQIVAGRVPSYKIWENDDWYAFLTINPHTPGHTLVIPKTHVDYLFDLDERLLADILLTAKPLAEAIKKSFNPQSGKVGLLVAGLEVPHAHLHLIGMDNTKDLDFVHSQKVAPAELEAIQAKLLANLKIL